MACLGGGPDSSALHRPFAIGLGSHQHISHEHQKRFAEVFGCIDMCIGRVNTVDA